MTDSKFAPNINFSTLYFRPLWIIYKKFKSPLPIQFYVDNIKLVILCALILVILTLR